MKIKIRIALPKVVLILIVLFLFACSKINDNPDYSKYDFAIYFLKDPNIKIGDITSYELINQDSQALAKIDLQESPWLTNNDIQMYDFSSHLLYLQSSKYNFLPNPVQLDIPPTWYYKPFMIVAGGKRRYLGYLRGFVDEEIWPFPVIDCSSNFLYPEDLLIISWQWFNHQETDTRNDKYVKESLYKVNILHEGLELKLKNLRFLENSDTATVEYTFTLTNNDTDILYILDPDKMGSDIFHYYNIGPQFSREGETFVRSATLWKPKFVEPSSGWDPNWFIKLNSKDSITRTISLRGYPFFPSGNYTCEVTFQSIKKISKSQRTLSDGRYWIGPIKSNLVAFFLN